MSAEYTPERAASLVDKIITLQDQEADIKEAIGNLKLKLASLYDNGPGEYTENGRKVTVYYHKALNADYAKKNEPDLYAKGSSLALVFNAKTASAKLTPEEYARVQKHSTEPSVVVELLED